MNSAKERQFMRRTAIFLVILGSVTAARAQGSSAVKPNAEVTFYSENPIWPALAPVSTGVAFYGNLFDAEQPLAYIEHGRFLTLRLAAGIHKFSATISAHHPDKESLLTIDMKPGGHYFVRASSNQKNLVVVPIMFVRGILQEVPCEAAQKEAGNAKPVSAKHVVRNVRSLLNPITSFPACP